MNWSQALLIYGAGVLACVAIWDFQRIFVRKMDELIGALGLVGYDARSGMRVIKEAILAEKTVKIPDDIVELLKKVSKKTPSTILDDYRPVYEAGLGDGAAELAKEILERIED